MISKKNPEKLSLYLRLLLLIWTAQTGPDLNLNEFCQPKIRKVLSKSRLTSQVLSQVLTRNPKLISKLLFQKNLCFKFDLDFGIATWLDLTEYWGQISAQDLGLDSVLKTLFDDVCSREDISSWKRWQLCIIFIWLWWYFVFVISNLEIVNERAGHVSFLRWNVLIWRIKMSFKRLYFEYSGIPDI